MLNVGEKIRTARKKSNLTQNDLAGNVGVELNTISRWENGDTHPSFLDVVKISYATKHSIEFFAGEQIQGEEIERKRLIGDLVQWASQNSFNKIKAVIEILK